MLPLDTFKIVVDSTPLISVDLIVKKDDKILLGKRVNKPAKGYYFSVGGSIFKNETILEAQKRVAKEELNLTLDKELKFIGVFEHFYEDSIFEEVSTHYVNLAFELEVDTLDNLPKDQHSEYKWFTLDELLQDNLVHPYVKEYFNEIKLAVEVK